VNKLLLTLTLLFSTTLFGQVQSHTANIVTHYVTIDDMVARNYFSHFDPITSESLVIIKPVVTECEEAGENIISVDEYGEKNTDAIKAWINSPSHYKAMVNPDNDLTGIATNGNIGVQSFCNLE
jgi:uncharacterized protein YkwD